METDEFYIHAYVIIFTLQDPELQLPALYPQNGLQWTALPPTAVSVKYILNTCRHTVCVCVCRMCVCFSVSI